MSDLLDVLGEIVGAQHVLTDGDLKAQYETDWTRRFHGSSLAVVRPGDTGEVSSVIRACAEAGVPLTVQGGNTGLVGGATPAGGDVLLSLGRLTEMAEVDLLEGQVTAGAGVTLERLQQHARPHGLDVGVDLAARSAATVGGLVATNAGGLRVVRYGSMRDQLTGIEAVLADGSVVTRLAGLAKDNTGYDLTQLLAGSEGTLAVITKVRLRLVPLLPTRAVALVAVSGVPAAIELLATARAGLASLSAAELFLADGLDLVRAHGKLNAPFAEAYPAYVTLECSARTDPTDELLEVLGESEAVLDATVASDATGVARLWAYRETHTEAISAAGVPVKLDVSVPLRELAGLVDDLPGTVAGAAPGARVLIFGHLGEGNLHVNVLEAGDRSEAVSEAVLELVASRHGSISSEHGVGRAKAHYLGLSRSDAEIAAMRRIKQAMDPAGTLNPGVLLA
ncbi:FAD-binding oxidoreductase [Actinoplanes sp. NPDC051633]|uniref:FAD-binding oxidoreductase n=1 Tax=Actinoplanes sp. NPDC051633 TaxID=3155670 RepID=UPI003419D784